MRPERASLLSSYLSPSMVGHCLHVWHIFSYVMPYFENWLLGSVLASFQNTSVFFIYGFLSYFLVGFLFFLCLKGLVCVNYSLS
jgi:hypothetical protein